LPYKLLARRRRDLTSGAAVGITATLVGICLFRAATQSIAHDEALTYQLFISGTWRRAFAYTGNQNHILLVLASKALLAVLPVSELTLRLPVVACAVVYCAAAATLLRRYVADPWLRTAGLAAIALNPYVIDYFCEARGYGMMLAFLLAAMCFLMPRAGETRTARRLLAGGVMMGLALAAVMVSLFPVAGMLAACLAVDALSMGRRKALTRAALVAGAAAAVAVPMIAPQVYRAQRKDYYVGAPSIPAWIASLVKGGWSHTSGRVESLSEVTPAEWIVAGVAAVALIAIVALAIRQLWRWRSATDAERALVWIAIVLVVMAGAAVGAHVVAGVRYPEGRIALYWIPLLLFAAALAVDSAPPRSAWRAGSWVLIAALLANTIAHLPATRYADNRFDAATREAVARIAADRPAADGFVSIGGSWQLEPGLNFYRVVQRLDWMTPVERRTPARGDDYYVLLPEDAGLVDTLGLRVLYRDPVVGTTVAVPREKP
jgi:uncharacterized membrane protein